MRTSIGLFYILLNLTCKQGAPSEYLGCFKDKKYPNRALPNGSRSWTDNSRDYCSNSCFFQGFKYFGLQQGFECWCGYSGYDKYGISTGCHYPCTGNFRETCGGKHINSVYKLIVSSTTTGTGAASHNAKLKSSFTRSLTSTKKKVDALSLNDGNLSPFTEQVGNRGTFNLAAIVGAVIACTVITLVVLLLVCLCRFRSSTRKGPYEPAGRQTAPLIPLRQFGGGNVSRQIIRPNGVIYEDIDEGTRRLACSQRSDSADDDSNYIDFHPSDTVTTSADYEPPKNPGRAERRVEDNPLAQASGEYVLDGYSVSLDESTCEL